MINVIAIGYLLLHVLAIFVNPTYLWGVDSFFYFNPAISVFLGLLVILSTFENIQKKVFVQLSKIFGKLNSRNIIIAISIVAFLMFALSTATHLLGDGYLRIRNLEGHIFLSSSEPLDNIFHWSLYKLQRTLNFFEGADIYKLVSIHCGMIVMYNFLQYILKRNFKSENVAIGFLIFLGIGSFQIFFGYVESYAISSCLLILFILSSIESIENKTPLIKPTIIFSLAVLFHTSVIVAIPSLLFLYYKYWNWDSGKKKVLISFGSFLMILIASISILSLITGESLVSKYWETITGQSNLMPLLSNNEIYGILSLNHFLDIFNQLLLVAPALLFLPLIFKNIKASFSNDILLFLIVISLSYLFLIVTFKPVLGYARDWDLFSFVGFPITIFIILNLLKDETQVNYKILPLIVVALLHTFSFIAINSSESLSLQRAEKLAETPYWTNKAKSLLYDELGIYYKNKDDILNSIAMNDKAYKYEKNPRYLLRNANIYLKNNDIQSAEKYYQELVITGNGTEEIYNFLADIYFETKQYDKALYYYKLCLDLNPSNFLAWNNVGLILMNKLDYENAKAALKQSIKNNPNDPHIYYYLSICNFNLKDFSQALTYAEKAKAFGYKKSIIETLEKEIIKEMK